MVKKVHLIFKTHLDLGFTDLAANVANNYFEDFIPRALQLAEKSRSGRRKDNFVWTVGSWLVDQYLERTDDKGRESMERAIAEGDISWHALPFTTHSELADASLFQFGIGLSHALDQQFGKTTIAAKMTDVPGHTRSIISHLSSAGIQFLHIGINPACTNPDLPPLHLWRNPYGEEVIVMVQRDYGDVMVLPCGETAIAVSHTGDNHGPPSMLQIDEAYWSVRQRFPGAEVKASTLNAIAEELVLLRDQLPVITQEVGDTWIHGVGTDPTKVRRYRELSRLRQEWLADGRLQPGSSQEKAFSLPLLTIAEHTWGMDEKTHLADFECYSGKDFDELLTSKHGLQFASSWDEQRGYLDEALAGLTDDSLKAEAGDRLASSEPTSTDLSDYELVSKPFELFSNDYFDFAFGPDGSLSRLFEKSSGREWIGEDSQIGQINYQTFSKEDYDRFFSQYATQSPYWAVVDLTKPGIEHVPAKSATFTPKLVSLYRHRDGQSFVAELELKDATHGAPRKWNVEWIFSSDAPQVSIDVKWFDKPANRLPEALWMSIQPSSAVPKGWTLDKMGQPISPIDVVSKGNRNLHAVDRFVHYADSTGSLVVETIDAPLVAPGEPSLLDFNDGQPPLEKGIHFNLYNNVWGTNFPMWFGEDARFRFTLQFGDAASATWSTYLSEDGGSK